MAVVESSEVIASRRFLLHVLKEVQSGAVELVALELLGGVAKRGFTVAIKSRY